MDDNKNLPPIARFSRNSDQRTNNKQKNPKSDGKCCCIDVAFSGRHSEVVCHRCWFWNEAPGRSDILFGQK